MESYDTEAEQLEALRRWWKENGPSTIAAVIISLSAGFGWQAWTANQTREQESASGIYQSLVQAISEQPASGQREDLTSKIEQLKSDYSGTTYAQFAALHGAAIAVNDGNMSEAEVQLRWVLGKAAKNSETAQLAQLRLARVVADRGETEQALAILGDAQSNSFSATYAAARGDILFAAGRNSEAREAYALALATAASAGSVANLPILQQKFQHLSALLPAQAEDESASMLNTVEKPDSVDDGTGEEG